MTFFNRVTPVIFGAVMVAVQYPYPVVAQDIQTIAREITVRIEGENPATGGSGVIIKKEGNLYTILTAWHVVENSETYQISTSDQQEYTALNIRRLGSIDLAVMEFTSNSNYQVAQLGNSDLVKVNDVMYVSGWLNPLENVDDITYLLIEGKITNNSNSENNSSDGYSLTYNGLGNYRGMSGGPVLNTEGKLIGINGKAVTDSENNLVGLYLAIPLNNALRLIAEPYLTSAKTKYDQADFEGMLADLNQAILIAPNNAVAYTYRGTAYFALNAYQVALTDYTQAITINPNLADAYNNRGSVYSYLKEYEKAITDFTEAIRINPNDADAYNNRGAAYFNLKEYEKAIADLTQAITINPNLADAYNNRGSVYFKLQEYEKAIADFNEAIRINPNYADAYYNRGSVYSYLKEYEKAITDFTEAIRINPNDADAYHNRGYAYDNLQDYEKAISDFTQAITINPNYANAYYNRGTTYQLLGDNQNALSDFRQAASLYQQQGDTEGYNYAINEIRKLEH